MRGNKTAVWQNGTGQEIVFDNRTFFLEDIDMTGTAGIHTVETLARADGQVSIAHQLAAKTIPCSFAWYDSTQEGVFLGFCSLADNHIVVCVQDLHFNM